MKKTTIKNRIIACILSVSTVFSVVAFSVTSAFAAEADQVIEKTAYSVGLAAISEYVPGGKLISAALGSICGSFMDNGPSLGDISKDISDMRNEMNTQFNDIKNQMKNYTEAIENKIVDQTVISGKGIGLDKLMTALKNTGRQIDSINKSFLNDKEKAVEIAALIGNNTQWNKTGNMYFEYQDLMDTLSSNSFADQKNRDLFQVLCSDYYSKVMFSGEAKDLADPYVQRVMLLGLYAYSINAECLKAAQTVSKFTESDEASLNRDELNKYNSVKSLTNIVVNEINAMNTQMFDAKKTDSVAAHYISYEKMSRTVFLNKGTESKALKNTLAVAEMSDNNAAAGLSTSHALSNDNIKALADYIKSTYPGKSFRGYLTTVGFNVSAIKKNSHFVVGNVKDGGYYIVDVDGFKYPCPNPYHADQISIDDNSFKIEDRACVPNTEALLYKGQYLIGFAYA